LSLPPPLPPPLPSLPPPLPPPSFPPPLSPQSSCTNALTTDSCNHLRSKLPCSLDVSVAISYIQYDELNYYTYNSVQYEYLSSIIDELNNFSGSQSIQSICCETCTD
jgi:hypothetical protein